MILTTKIVNDAVRATRREINGVLLLNKPHGLTSNQALQKVKRLLNAKKAGHTGSLDPAATGMLPLCFGEATKISAWLLDADKKYRVTVRLGESTDTGDADGKVVATAEVPELLPADWDRLFARFAGEIEQVPPMYSALKVDGQRLYALARQGRTVERKPRQVRIHGVSVLEARGRRLVFRVHCSKGTYIRTLVEDLARAAGTIAYTAGLHRESVGHFPDAGMLDLGTVERVAEEGADALRRHLLPPDRALLHWPEQRLDRTRAARFGQGQEVAADPGSPEDRSCLVRVYGASQEFMGVGELTGTGSLKPRRVFRSDS